MAVVNNVSSFHRVQLPILIVEDDLSCLTFLTDAMDHMGVRSDVAMTGRDALWRLQSHQYGGAILDLSLPDTSGLEVLESIRAGHHLTPVVVLSGTSTVSTAVAALKLGAIDFIEKPINRTTLYRCIETLLRTTDASKMPVTQNCDSLTSAIVAVATSSVDVCTVRAWSATVGRSESSLYALFEVQSVGAKAALDLGRILRLKLQGAQREQLSAADPRTVRRLFNRAGLTEASIGSLTLAAILDNQHLVNNGQLLDRVLRRLRECQSVVQ